MSECECGCSCGNTEESGDWASLSDEQKLQRIEQVLDDQVRPMLKSDGGGMQVVSLDGDVLTISYSGACGGCPHALTGTKLFITRQLAEALGIELIIEVVRPQ